MFISYNWLRELTGTSSSPNGIKNLLTMVGLAVDSVEERGDDFVLDVEVPSNRSDCLSHVGIARELCAIERLGLRLPSANPSAVAETQVPTISVQIQDADLCSRYAGRVVRGVKIGPSPEWMVKKLEAIGQRPINNVADITNYLLHELGQPLHAFDLAKVAGQEIVVRRAREGEMLRTLDGVERILDSEMLVIADAERAVALAGVMGGRDSEINEATRDVLIESANFHPRSVRRTAKLLGLHTEASHRFERGVDREGVLRAHQRCVDLICEIADGTMTEEAVDVYPARFDQPQIFLRMNRVAELTGLHVPVDEAVRILAALGFDLVSPEVASDSPLLFLAPSWRLDVEREEDLVEEVARHFGYDKITDELPAAKGAGEYHPIEARKRSMRRALGACGYSEAVSFSFVDAQFDDSFEVIPDLIAKGAGDLRFVTLSNPIIEGASRMRASLLPGLLSAVRHNFNHGRRDLCLYEMGRVFAAKADSSALPEEREALAIVATGGLLEACRAATARDLDFYDLKGAMDSAIEALHLPHLEFVSADVTHLREGQAATVLAQGRAIGSIGQVADSIAAGFKFRQPVFVAELDIDALMSLTADDVRYSPLARFPSIVRDVSLLVSRSVTVEMLIESVREQRVDLCRGAALVGIYEGANVKEAQKSVTLRIEYWAEERTLRDDDVDLIHGQIVDSLTRKFGAEIRI